jgi:cobyrinic acid a,c-diamide synthase
MQHDPNRRITLVLGGVRSGKSSYAQRMAEQAREVIFVATAERRDDEEMRRKIERHRADRPSGWRTVEEPLDLAVLLAQAGSAETILIDCLTLFAANLLEAYPEDEPGLNRRVDEFCRALKSSSCPVIMVSNEVGSGVVPAYALGRRFRDLVGEINQRIAAIANSVILMTAGLPLALKGQLPVQLSEPYEGCPGFLVAGTASGVGKTTVTLAFTSALLARGFRVQVFKGGPDFLDTGHHTRISGRVARNLDTWMLSNEANRDVVQDAMPGADVLIAEGMMGLFDGKDGMTETGSSAEIAKLLNFPVLLVVDAGKSARSVAAIVLGFESFDPNLPLAGVILNHVASERHFEMLQAAIHSACKTPVLGWLPRDSSITIPERHLGLRAVEESEGGKGVEALRARLASLAEKHLDVPRLLALRTGVSEDQGHSLRTVSEKVRIGIARDKAFSFYYEDNLDLLREHGATLVPFSPLSDAELPADLDAVYLGGGYPELHAGQLSSNLAMLAAVREFVSSGRPVYAECGGMIFLSEQLTTMDGTRYPLAQVLPFEIEMTSKLVNFGYVTVELTHDCMLGSVGATLRGHSFHYSRIANDQQLDTTYRIAYSLSRREEDEGFRIANVLASYVHLHFRTSPGVAESFVNAAVSSRKQKIVTQ